MVSRETSKSAGSTTKNFGERTAGTISSSTDHLVNQDVRSFGIRGFVRMICRCFDDMVATVIVELNRQKYQLVLYSDQESGSFGHIKKPVAEYGTLPI